MNASTYTYFIQKGIIKNDYVNNNPTSDDIEKYISSTKSIGKDLYNIKIKKQYTTYLESDQSKTKKILSNEDIFKLAFVQGWEHIHRLSLFIPETQTFDWNFILDNIKQFNVSTIGIYFIYEYLKANPEKTTRDISNFQLAIPENYPLYIFDLPLNMLYGLGDKETINYLKFIGDNFPITREFISSIYNRIYSNINGIILADSQKPISEQNTIKIWDQFKRVNYTDENVSFFNMTIQEFKKFEDIGQYSPKYKPFNNIQSNSKTDYQLIEPLISYLLKTSYTNSISYLIFIWIYLPGHPYRNYRNHCIKLLRNILLRVKDYTPSEKNFHAAEFDLYNLKYENDITTNVYHNLPLLWKWLPQTLFRLVLFFMLNYMGKILNTNELCLIRKTIILEDGNLLINLSIVFPKLIKNIIETNKNITTDLNLWNKLSDKIAKKSSISEDYIKNLMLEDIQAMIEYCQRAGFTDEESDSEEDQEYHSAEDDENINDYILKDNPNNQVGDSILPKSPKIQLNIPEETNISDSQYYIKRKNEILLEFNNIEIVVNKTKFSPDSLLNWVDNDPPTIRNLFREKFMSLIPREYYDLCRNTSEIYYKYINMLQNLVKYLFMNEQSSQGREMDLINKLNQMNFIGSIMAQEFICIKSYLDSEKGNSMDDYINWCQKKSWTDKSSYINKTETLKETKTNIESPVEDASTHTLTKKKIPKMLNLRKL